MERYAWETAAKQLKLPALCSILMQNLKNTEAGTGFNVYECDYKKFRSLLSMGLDKVLFIDTLDTAGVNVLNLIPKNQILSKISPKPTLRERERFLLQKIRSGDKAAFMELVSPFQERLFRKAKSMVGDDDDAEDIVQDALISGYKSIAKFRADSGVYTWLYRIVVNKSKDLILKKKKSNEKPLNDNDQTFFDERLSYEKKLELSDESAYLIKKINMLEPMYRQVIDLRYYEELSYSEIADLLKCNVGTVKSRIFKAKELLKHLILNDEKEK